jgi:hypothetical protein
VVRNRLKTQIAGDFARWLIERFGGREGFRLPFEDEADINIVMLEWIGVDHSAFAAEHARMLAVLNDGQ